MLYCVITALHGGDSLYSARYRVNYMYYRIMYDTYIVTANVSAEYTFEQIISYSNHRKMNDLNMHVLM
jgi:hypothetical protein